MGHILIFSVFNFVLLSFSYGQDYSIKNRWNTKLSLSFNRINERNTIPSISFDKIPTHPLMTKLNMRAECNYGVTNWLELGGYIGFIRYKNYNHYYYNPSFRKMAKTPAPTFGVNVNVHLLPFFNVNKNCRWEWYVTAKYGGAYLINYDIPVIISSMTINQGKNPHDTTYFHAEDSDKRYRQVFGIGMGGGVYFWNLFGLYAEALVGQYSYFPKMASCYWTARVGIEFKFYSKQNKNKAKNTEIQPKHIEL